MLQRTPRRRGETRERLLELAEAAVLAKGFAGTSIDELIAAAGITKGGFFYHFSDKGALAKALLLRYLEQDERILSSIFARCAYADEEPLQSFLAALDGFADMLANLPHAHPGCLAASYCYQDQLFSQDIRDLNAAGMVAWRRRFLAILARIAARHRPRSDVDLETVADMATTLVEGGIVLSKVMKDSTLLPKQVRAYRDYVRLLFAAD